MKKKSKKPIKKKEEEKLQNKVNKKTEKFISIETLLEITAKIKQKK